MIPNDGMANVSLGIVYIAQRLNTASTAVLFKIGITGTPQVCNGRWDSNEMPWVGWGWVSCDDEKNYKIN